MFKNRGAGAGDRVSSMKQRFLLPASFARGLLAFRKAGDKFLLNCLDSRCLDEGRR